MKDPIKITEEELLGFNNLKFEIQKNTFEFGVLYLEKVELDALYKDLSDKENKLRENISTFKKQESDLMNGILQKYGEGALNVATGVFTPN